LDPGAAGGAGLLATGTFGLFGGGDGAVELSRKNIRRTKR